jgi:cytochrome b561
MSANDLEKKYSLGTRIIHWCTVILILILFPLGKFMDGLAPADKMDLVQLHAILGNLVLILTLFRIYFFFKHERPERAKTGSKFNDKLVVFIHNSFYFVLLALTLSGIAVFIIGGYGEALINDAPEMMKSHGQIPPLETHGLFASIIMILLVFHVAGVLKHFFLRKENMFKRIF